MSFDTGAPLSKTVLAKSGGAKAANAAALAAAASKGKGGAAAGFGLSGCGETSGAAGRPSVWVETFPKNRVGLHVVELSLRANG